MDICTLSALQHIQVPLWPLEGGRVHEGGDWLEGFDCLAPGAGVNFVITRHSGTSKGNKVNDIHAAKALTTLLHGDDRTAGRAGDTSITT